MGGTWAHNCSVVLVAVTSREDEDYLYIPRVSCYKIIFVRVLFESSEEHPQDVAIYIQERRLGWKH